MYGPPPAPWIRPEPRKPSEIAFGAVAGLLLLGSSLLNGALLFLLCFVGDGCGSTAMSRERVCHGSGAAQVFAAPWVSLVAAVAAAGVVAARARRRGRTPWLALLPGVLVHGAGLAFVYASIWG
ncbi:hypothetical protein ACFW1A_32070 [Kitasatospora sp. NPDC058965]|uniref:hypothetical protein n=1 Tax=Kitasatospora sp. NPDC058965 TaxID=3346682 RepID=UPI0036CFDD81